jgi:hypothetical protein
MRKIQFLVLLSTAIGLSPICGQSSPTKGARDKDFEVLQMYVGVLQYKEPRGKLSTKMFVAPWSDAGTLSQQRLDAIAQELAAKPEAKLSSRQSVVYANEAPNPNKYHVEVFAGIKYDYSKPSTENLGQIKVVLSDVSARNEANKEIYIKDAKDNRIGERDTVDLNTMGQIFANFSIRNEYKTSVSGSYSFQLISPAKYVHQSISRKDFSKPIIWEQDTLIILAIDTARNRLYMEYQNMDPKIDIKLTDAENHVNNMFIGVRAPKAVFELVRQKPNITDEELKAFYNSTDKEKIKKGKWVLVITCDVNIEQLHLFKTSGVIKTAKQQVPFAITEMPKKE